MTSRQIHKLLKKTFGFAKEFDCVDCGKQAEDWSFDRKKGFSTNLKRYKPRCRSCHRKKDAKGNDNWKFLVGRKYGPLPLKTRLAVAKSNKRRAGWHHTKKWLKENIKYRDEFGRFKKR